MRTGMEQNKIVHDQELDRLCGSDSKHSLSLENWDVTMGPEMRVSIKDHHPSL